MKTLSLFLLLLSPSTVLAQYAVPSGGALGVGFAYVTANGNDFEGTEAGPGIQGSLRYTAPKGATINFAVQFSSHDVEGLDDNIHLLALIVEPGYTARIPKSSVAPFVRARLGYVRETLSTLGVDADANGFVGGAVGGILFQVGPQVGIETGVSFNLIHFGDASVDGTSFSDTDANGNSVSLHIGFVLSFTNPLSR